MKSKIHYLFLLGCSILFANATLAQTEPDLGHADKYALLSGGNVSASDSLLAHDYAGATGAITNLCRADVAVHAYNTADVDTAIADLQSAQLYCRTLSGTTLTHDLINDSLNTGVYFIDGDLTIGGSFRILGNSADALIINIDGDLHINDFTVFYANNNNEKKHIYFNVAGALLIGHNTSVTGTFMVEGNALVHTHAKRKFNILALGNIHSNGRLDIYSHEHIVRKGKGEDCDGCWRIGLNPIIDNGPSTCSYCLTDLGSETDPLNTPVSICINTPFYFGHSMFDCGYPICYAATGNFIIITDAGMSVIATLSNLTYNFNSGIHPILDNLLNPLTYTFTTPGVYKIDFNWDCIFDPGTGSSASYYINVVDTDPAVLNVAIPDVCTGSPVVFDDQSNPAYDAFCIGYYLQDVIDFGDGSSNSNLYPGSSINHTYPLSPAPHTYTATLTHYSACGTTTTNQDINILPLPDISVSATPDPFCPGELITVSATSAAAISSTVVWTPSYTGWTTLAGGTDYPLTTTTYTATVTDAINECEATGSFTLEQDEDCCDGEPVIPPLQNVYNSGASYVINQDIVIPAGLAHYFTGSTFYINTGISITVQTGGVLIINNSVLMACHDMWQGVIIEPGASLLVINNSTVQDALYAVESQADAVDFGYFYIDQSTFDKNYIDVNLEPFAGTNTSTITNSVFTHSGALLPNPYSAVNSLFCVQVTEVTNFTIGDPSTGQNLFEKHYIGINAIRNSGAACMLEVYNNEFGQMINCSTCSWIKGCGIYGKAYSFIIGGAAAGEPNYFHNMANGVREDGNGNIDILYNTFENILLYSSGASAAVTIDNCKNGAYQHHVENNLFQTVSTGINYYSNKKCQGFFRFNELLDFKLTGIIAMNNSSVSITITENYFNISSYVPVAPASVNQTAIRVQNAAGMTLNLCLINKNTIWYVRNGILVTGINAPKVIENGIDFSLSYSGFFTWYGIRMQQTPKSQVDNNMVEKSAPDPTAYLTARIYGISMENGWSSSKVTNNTVLRMGTGINCLGTGVSLTLKCNDMDHCFHGLTLNNSNIGPQGTTTTVNDNRWSNNTLISGSVAARGLNSWTIPSFYTRTNTWGYFPSGTGCMNPGGTLLLAGTVPGAPSNNCEYGNPGGHRLMANVATDSFPYNEYFEEPLFQEKRGLYELLEYDSTLMDSSEYGTELAAFYDSARYTNIGKFMAVVKNLMDEDTAQANIINSNITAMNQPELNQQTVNEIFLRTWVTGELALSPEDSAILLAIAMQNPIFGGQAVYDARVMTGYEQDDNEDVNARMMHDPEANVSINKNKVIIYPNPVRSVLTIESGSVCDGELKLILRDMYGREALSCSLKGKETTMSVNVENLNTGIYFCEIICNHASIGSGKIVIQR